MSGVERQALLERREDRRVDGEELLLKHLEFIERVARSAARRTGFQLDDAEDFASSVSVKLIEGDYAVFRKYRGDSSFTTYLTVVIQNLFKDFCNHKLGKFRSSAKAKELGSTAIALERLLVRDLHDLDSAIRILKNRPEIEASPKELRELAAQLPPRAQTRLVGDAELADHESTSPETAADRQIVEGERSATVERINKVLNLALEAVSSQDLLILKMRFRDGKSYADIASALRLQQRSVYAQKDKCLEKLQATFAAHGLTWEEVREILGWQGHEIRDAFDTLSGPTSTGSASTDTSKP